VPSCKKLATPIRWSRVSMSLRSSTRLRHTGYHRSWRIGLRRFLSNSNRSTTNDLFAIWILLLGCWIRRSFVIIIKSMQLQTTTCSKRLRFYGSLKVIPSFDGSTRPMTNISIWRGTRRSYLCVHCSSMCDCTLSVTKFSELRYFTQQLIRCV
jgi:hypothetical protein